jgi:hypothetical protein
MEKDRGYQLPKARQDKLIVKELSDEVLVYDLERDKAHCLNHTAGLVWKYCDGKSSVKEIAASLGDATQTAMDDRIVWLALEQLEKFHLLESAPAKPAFLADMNRRQLVRRLGLTAVAIPMIVSMAAPTAQAASSCNPNGQACGSSSQCCSGRCCGSPGFPPPCGPNNTCF